jgi:hypothetical protein
MTRRGIVLGKVCDIGEPIPFDCGYYQVSWDNEHASGTLRRSTAANARRNAPAPKWEAGNGRQSSPRPASGGRRPRRTWEVREVEPQPEVDPEELPDSPRPNWA